MGRVFDCYCCCSCSGISRGKTLADMSGVCEEDAGHFFVCLIYFFVAVVWTGRGDTLRDECFRRLILWQLPGLSDA